MADFQEIARNKIKDLSSKKSSTRRDAAYYLGEAGVDEAITKLATMYKSDPDKGVRKAAGYALGQFRAVEQALNNGEEERVVELLKRVVDEGKFGSRLKTSVKALVRLEFVLFLLFLLLVGLNLMMPGLKPLAIAGFTMPNVAALFAPRPAADTERGPLIEQLRTSYERIHNDGATLRAQFAQVLTGGQLTCSAFFNGSEPVVLSENDTAAYPDLLPAVSALNTAQEGVATAKQRFDDACFGGQPIQMEEIGGLLGPFNAKLEMLTSVEALLATPTVNLDVPATAAPATAAPAATSIQPTQAQPTQGVSTIVPTTPTVPVEIANPRAHLGPLYDIIESMNGQRGANGLLAQYWQDAASAGVTDGCNIAPPPIPEDYVLPQVDAQASPELVTAVDNVNLGLKLTRQGWTLFTTACQSGTLAAQASTGVSITQTAKAAFDVASGLLDAVRNSA
jgi:hypothetical protein